jgi:ABC-type spermidine/putrescine transport system permease subunit II
MVGTLCGTLAATGLLRGRFPGKTLLMAVILSPMIVPTIVIAIAIYYLFARQRLVGTTMGLVLAHLVLAIPYVVVVVAGALRTVDEALERAALTLGAGRVQAFIRVTLPLIMPAMLTAAFFAFLASFDDLVIALFISGTRAATLPKRMWEGIRFEIDPTTAAVSALLIGLSLVLLGVAEIARIKGQRSGRAGAVEPEVR